MFSAFLATAWPPGWVEPPIYSLWGGEWEWGAAAAADGAARYHSPERASGGLAFALLLVLNWRTNVFPIHKATTSPPPRHAAPSTTTTESQSVSRSVVYAACLPACPPCCWLNGKSRICDRIFIIIGAILEEIHRYIYIILPYKQHNELWINIRMAYERSTGGQDDDATSLARAPLLLPKRSRRAEAD